MSRLIPQIASCVRTKDTGRYLPEWIAYHWAIGVDEFAVFDDESIDDTREVLLLYNTILLVILLPYITNAINTFKITAR